MEESRAKELLSKMNDEDLYKVAGGQIVYIEEDDRWLCFTVDNGHSMLADFETRNEAVAYCKAHGYRTNEWTREQFNRQFQGCRPTNGCPGDFTSASPGSQWNSANCALAASSRLQLRNVRAESAVCAYDMQRRKTRRKGLVMNFEDLKNPELQEKLKAAKTPDELVALAKEEGVALNGEQIGAISRVFDML